MRYFGKIAKGLLALIFAMAIATLISLKVCSRSIEEMLITEIENQFETDLEIGSSTLDLFSAFPRITAEFENVYLPGNDDLTFIKIHSVEVKLHPLTAIFDQLKVESIKLAGGYIGIRKIPDGSFNYQVFRRHKNEGNGVWLSIRKAILENINVVYHDPARNQQISANILNGTIKGNFSSSQMDFDVDLNLRNSNLQLGSNTFLNHRNAVLQGALDINLKNLMYRFHDLKFEFPGVECFVDGIIHQYHDHSSYQLDINLPDSRAEQFIALMPNVYRKYFIPYDISGQITANGFIKGRMSQSENPGIKFNVHVNHGLATQNQLEEDIHFELDGSFTNGMMRNLSSTFFEINRLEGQYNNNPFLADLKLSDLKDPELDLNFKGFVPVAIANTYLPDSLIDITSGIIKVDRFQFQDLWLNHQDFTDIDQIDAIFSLSNIRGTVRDKLLDISRGSVEMKKGQISVDSLYIQYGKTDIRVNADMTSLGNALQAMQADHLSANFVIKSDFIQLDDFIKPIFHASSTDVTKRIAPKYVNTPESPRVSLLFPSGQFKIEAKELEFGSLQFSKITSDLTTSGSTLKFNTKGNSLSGSFNTSGTFEASTNPRMEMKLQTANVDIQECFRQYHNLGQNIVSADNIKGRLDVMLLVKSEWDEGWNFIRNNLAVSGGISISQGTLKNVELLKRFSKYVHIEDLQNIQFEKLDNFIEIKNGNFYLPVMFIQSNALNLTVNGIHSMDNKILYNFKINAGQVLTNKLRKHNPDLRPVRARKKGTVNLYYSIYGTPDEYELNSNKSVIVSSFDQSSKLRDEIKLTLSNSFGRTVNLIEPEEWQDIEDYNMELHSGPDEFIEFTPKKH